MARSNEEIIEEYRERFLAIVKPIVEAAVKGERPDFGSSAAKELVQIIHMGKAYEADPARSLILVKAAWDLDEYRERYTTAELNSEITWLFKFYLDVDLG